MSKSTRATCKLLLRVGRQVTGHTRVYLSNVRPVRNQITLNANYGDAKRSVSIPIDSVTVATATNAWRSIDAPMDSATFH